MAAAAMAPPLISRKGLTPKNAGFQSTRSASLPSSIEPTACEIPCAIAGLIVYLEIYLFILRLSERDESPLAEPLWSFILCAHCQVRRMTSPTRPIACESEDI